jgi:hypothetical protein
MLIFKMMEEKKNAEELRMDAALSSRNCEQKINAFPEMKRMDGSKLGERRFACLNYYEVMGESTFSSFFFFCGTFSLDEGKNQILSHRWILFQLTSASPLLSGSPRRGMVISRSRDQGTLRPLSSR